MAKAKRGQLESAEMSSPRFGVLSMLPWSGDALQSIALVNKCGVSGRFVDLMAKPSYDHAVTMTVWLGTRFMPDF
jgi:hypothetical protein